MPEKEEELANRDEKRHQKNGATYANSTNLTKRALDIEESNGCTKAIEAEAKFLAENRIMLAELSIMDLVQKAWFEKKQVIIPPHDA
jgi:hypothetical protein